MACAAVQEMAGSSVIDPIRAIQLGTPVPPQAIVGQPSDTEEHRREAQMNHFNCLDPPEFTSKGKAIEADEWIRKINKYLDTWALAVMWIEFDW